jgi:hypothetical protein
MSGSVQVHLGTILSGKLDMFKQASVLHASFDK